MIGDRQIVQATSMQEKMILTAPLGLRFWDAASASMLIEGLSVTVYAQNQPQQCVKAYMTPHGVYALRDLPGMRAIKYGQGGADFQNNSEVTPAAKPFIVEVVDTWPEARFLPFSFSLLLPNKGIYRWEVEADTLATDSRKEAPIPLYSAPTRSVPGGMAVLRVELQEATTGKAAAWAVLEAQLPVPTGSPPVTVRGLADWQGRVALVFPYPMPVKDTPTSPDIPLSQQEWQLPLQARYVPSQAVRLSSAGSALPDLREVLKQPAASLWNNFASRQPFSSALLQFGREAVAHSQDLSVLLITAAA